jgi:hypothetical protein
MGEVAANAALDQRCRPRSGWGSTGDLGTAQLLRRRGIYGPLFHSSPYVVGWVEAHGLAALIGIVFIVVGASDGGRRWHVVALCVHMLLGTANIVFWSAFRTFGMVAAGIVATTGHLLLGTAHLIAIASVGRKRR